MQDQESSVLAALRREPEKALLLLKLSLVAAAGLVAWDLLAAMTLPEAIVKLVLALLVLAYGAAMTVLVVRLVASSGLWSAGSASAAARLSSLAASRQDGEHSDGRDAPSSQDLSTAFNESYFLMRLHEQVKDARRSGYAMSVAVVHVTLPGMDMTPEIAQAAAYDMARITAEQARIVHLPLALGDSEFVFSLPHTGLNDTRQFVREVVRALGDYWCYFGIAAFPDHATTAQGLVEKAREACEASRLSGKRGPVEYSVA